MHEWIKWGSAHPPRKRTRKSMRQAKKAAKVMKAEKAMKEATTMNANKKL